MMSMVERVARALRRQWHIDNFDRPSEVGWEDEINAARAAIEAMREPTESMYRAAYKEQDDSAIHNYGAAPTFDDYWSTAIDAALNEQVAG